MFISKKYREYKLAMKDQLLLKCNLGSFRYQVGKKREKKTRIPTINAILTMNHHKRNNLHEALQKGFSEHLKLAYSKKPWAHESFMTYKVSIGFKDGKAELSGRKTGRLDMDNLGWLLKTATDSLIDISPIPDDSFRYVTESRCCYMGPSSGEEELWLQVVGVVRDDYGMTEQEKDIDTMNLDQAIGEWNYEK